MAHFMVVRVQGMAVTRQRRAHVVFSGACRLSFDPLGALHTRVYFYTVITLVVSASKMLLQRFHVMWRPPPTPDGRGETVCFKLNGHVAVAAVVAGQKQRL
jgi:hypothetical protein